MQQVLCRSRGLSALTPVTAPSQQSKKMQFTISRTYPSGPAEMRDEVAGVLAAALVRAELLTVCICSHDCSINSILDSVNTILARNAIVVVRLAAPFGGPARLQARLALALGLADGAASGPDELLAALWRPKGATESNSPVPLVLAIADAHQMGVRGLEYLELLQRQSITGARPLRLLLVGYSALSDTLNAPTLAILRGRVSTSIDVTEAASAAGSDPFVRALADDPSNKPEAENTVPRCAATSAMTPETPPGKGTATAIPPKIAVGPITASASIRFFADAAVWTASRRLRTPGSGNAPGPFTAKIFGLARSPMRISIGAASVVILIAIWQVIVGGTFHLQSIKPVQPILARVETSSSPLRAAPTYVSIPPSTVATASPAGTSTITQDVVPQGLRGEVGWAGFISPLLSPPLSEQSAPSVWAEAEWAVALERAPKPLTIPDVTLVKPEHKAVPYAAGAQMASAGSVVAEVVVPVPPTPTSPPLLAPTPAARVPVAAAVARRLSAILANAAPLNSPAANPAPASAPHPEPEPAVSSVAQSFVLAPTARTPIASAVHTLAPIESSRNSARVVLHALADSSKTDRVAALLASKFGAVERRTVNTTPRALSIRYFFENDAAAARTVAATLELAGLPWRIQAFTTFLPLPRHGTIEVWMPR